MAFTLSGALSLKGTGFCDYRRRCGRLCYMTPLEPARHFRWAKKTTYL